VTPTLLCGPFFTAFPFPVFLACHDTGRSFWQMREASAFAGKLMQPSLR